MKINGKEVKLPKRFKDKWVKTLRSGKYEQGSGFLYDSDTNCYCCLGVAGALCEVSLDSLNAKGLYGGDFEHDFTKEELKKLPKLLIGSNDNKDEDYSVIVEKLTKMNDNGKSFEQIAAYINRYL